MAAEGMNRRDFLVTTLGVGFALAAGPAQATAIVTDTKGLTAGEVSIPVEGGTIPAYRAQPAGAGPFPVLLVIEEIFGVHEHIKDMCRRFAKQGYLAIAPELYARLGNVTAMTDIHQVLATVNKAPDKTEMSDLDATLAWAGKNGGNPARAGIAGFCRGGRTVWMYAAHNPSLKAAIAWYGPLGGKPSEAMPTQPLDVAGEIKVPVLGLYGGKDDSIPRSDIEAMLHKLKAGGNKSCEFVIYPDAGHAFNADYRPSYDADAAKRAWTRALDWLKTHGL